MSDKGKVKDEPSPQAYQHNQWKGAYPGGVYKHAGSHYAAFIYPDEGRFRIQKMSNNGKVGTGTYDETMSRWKGYHSGGIYSVGNDHFGVFVNASKKRFRGHRFYRNGLIDGLGLAKLAAVKELDQVVAFYSEELLNENSSSPAAKQLCRNLQKERDLLAVEIVEDDDEPGEPDDEDGTSKSQKECMKKKAEERKKEHPNEEADEEDYRWACYGEELAENAIERFQRYVEEKVKQEALKWGREADKKARKWLAERDITRSSAASWKQFIEVGGSIGRSASGSVEGFVPFKLKPRRPRIRR